MNDIANNSCCKYIFKKTRQVTFSVRSHLGLWLEYSGFIISYCTKAIPGKWLDTGVDHWPFGHAYHFNHITS